MGVKKCVQINLPKFCHYGRLLYLRRDEYNGLIGKYIFEDENKLQ
jgi:hypothetical protein